MYERRDRAKIGLRKGEFLSQPGGMVTEEKLEVEERMSAGMGVEVSSGWYFAFFSRAGIFCECSSSIRLLAHPFVSFQMAPLRFPFGHRKVC